MEDYKISMSGHPCSKSSFELRKAIASIEPGTVNGPVFPKAYIVFSPNSSIKVAAVNKLGFSVLKPSA